MAGDHASMSHHGHHDNNPALHPRDQPHTSEDENSGDSAPGRAKKRGKIDGKGGGPGGVQVIGQEITGGRKPRGRPPGSKNKPKPPIYINRDTGNGMRPHLLEVPGGSDVGDSVSGYARRKARGVCVLGGSGTVANVTLRQPATPNAHMTFHGRFDILSLSGAFLPPPAPPNSAGLTVVLVGAGNQVIGGTVVGHLQAAGPVLVIVASFQGQALTFDRLPLADDQDDGSGHPAIAPAEYGGPVYSVSPAQLGVSACQVSNADMPWAPNPRGPPY